jgi:hypothetical protein
LTHLRQHNNLQVLQGKQFKRTPDTAADITNNTADSVTTAEQPYDLDGRRKLPHGVELDKKTYRTWRDQQNNMLRQ